MDRYLIESTGERIDLRGSSYVKACEMSEYVIVRTYSAGVFLGIIAERNGKEAKIHNARRIWYWEGAASLSQLAVDGTSLPDRCKFPTTVPWIILTEVIEILPCTERAVKSLLAVPVWKI